MPSYCCIKSCNSNSRHNPDLRFYTFPQPRERNLKLKRLSELRIKRWYAAVNRKSVNLKVDRVCSKHFVSGKNANLIDCFNVDWVPTLHLYKSKKARIKELSILIEPIISVPSSSSREIIETEIDGSVGFTACLSLEPNSDEPDNSLIENNPNDPLSLEPIANQINGIEPVESASITIATQTDLSMNDIFEMEKAVKTKTKDISTTLENGFLHDEFQFFPFDDVIEDCDVSRLLHEDSKSVDKLYK